MPCPSDLPFRIVKQADLIQFGRAADRNLSILPFFNSLHSWTLVKRGFQVQHSCGPNARETRTGFSVINPLPCGSSGRIRFSSSRGSAMTGTASDALTRTGGYTQPFLDTGNAMVRDIVPACPGSRGAAGAPNNSLAGLRRARKAGKVLGRPPVDVDMHKVQRRRDRGESLRALASDLGCSAALLCKRARIDSMSPSPTEDHLTLSLNVLA